MGFPSEFLDCIRQHWHHAQRATGLAQIVCVCAPGQQDHMFGLLAKTNWWLSFTHAPHTHTLVAYWGVSHRAQPKHWMLVSSLWLPLAPKSRRLPARRPSQLQVDPLPQRRLHLPARGPSLTIDRDRLGDGLPGVSRTQKSKGSWPQFLSVPWRSFWRLKRHERPAKCLEGFLKVRTSTESTRRCCAQVSRIHDSHGLT